MYITNLLECNGERILKTFGEVRVRSIVCCFSPTHSLVAVVNISQNAGLRARVSVNGARVSVNDAGLGLVSMGNAKNYNK